jgi:hypothetical protein
MQERTFTSDVVVVGGGLAGVSAAIAAARTGAAVALINNRPVLGGNSSSEIRVWVCGATAHGAQKYARETGIMGELFLENQYRNPEGNPYFWDQVLLDAVRAEPRVQLFLNTDVTEVSASGSDAERHIDGVTAWQQGTELRATFLAPMFVDASGDGLVGALAGAQFASGREARSVFNEPWAPDEPDNDMLGSTMFFYSKDTGAPVRFVPPAITKNIADTGILAHRRVDARANGCDYWWIEWGGELDAVEDNEAIRDELWGVIYGIWDHIKNSGEYDADTLTLEWVGSVPGKREYRRFVGDHVLTQHDIMNQTRFEDRIGFGGWSIDLHPPGGMYSSDAGSKHLFTSGVYHIPFRSLYSKNVNNLLLAGRDISASHVAFGTTRVMATCAVTGEAAGVGAALATQHGVSPRDVGRSHLPELQRILLRQDASLLGVRLVDENDLAQRATVTASSTLRHIDVAEPSHSEAYPVDEHDLGIHVPVDPILGTMRILVQSETAQGIDVELWSTGGGENHIPVEFLQRRSVGLPRGRSWAEVQFDHRPDHPEDVVVLLRRQRGLSVIVSDEAAPYGVLMLLSRTPATAASRPQSNAWSAEELRRHSPVFTMSEATLAYEPSNVTNGLLRPFAGPQLWSSERTAPGRSEHLELGWAEQVTLSRVEVVFNADVDEDIVNLHHHRTPFAVIPELVRDYTIEACRDGVWTAVASVTDNRQRLRVHEFDAHVSTSAIRLVAERTNGSPWVSVVSVRAYA